MTDPVQMTNTGNTTWTSANLYRLASAGPNDNIVWTTNARAALQNSPVAPGQVGTFTFNVVAPSVPGVYNWQWQMVQDNVGHFGSLTQPVSITVNHAPSALQAASTGQALSGTPAYFSGTGCYTIGSAVALSGTVAHAQMLLGGILVAEYDDTGTTPLTTDPTLVRSSGAGQNNVPVTVIFDSTHFADASALPVLLKVWDSSGQTSAATLSGPVYNRAYVLEDLTLKQSGNVTANVVSHTQAMNLYTISSAADKNTIISALPTYTVFYAWTHSIRDNGSLAFGDGNAQPPPYNGYVDHYVYSFNVLSPNTSPKTSQPPYNFVFVDGCESAKFDDMAKAFFGLSAGQSTSVLADQAYFGFLDTPVDDPHNAAWTNQVWQNLQQGMDIDDARVNASRTVGAPHDYIPDGFGGATEVEARTQILGDNYTRVHGVYLAATSSKWFK